MPIRILIVDDHGILRSGLRNLLNPNSDLKVVGEASDGRQAVNLVAELQPDLVLLDISMPNMGGIEALPLILEKAPGTKVLMLTVHEDESLLRKAVRLGAAGYVIKRAVEAELIHAIRTVMQGDLYIHPAMTRALLKGVMPARSAATEIATTLTHRELDVLRLLVRGYTNVQIATQLCISARTVEGHRANLMGKLGVRSRLELVEYAEQHSLLD